MGIVSRAALIEIGTNSVKLLVADTGASDFRVRHFSRHTTRIGRGLAHGGRIDSRAIDENSTLIEELRRTAQRHACDRVFAFSTFALRRAANAGTARRRLEKSLGGPIHILTGREEARYAYASAKRNLRMAQPNAVMIDIGGGSTELVAAVRGRVFCARSLPLGALHLTERFIRTDPIDPLVFASLERHVARVVRKAFHSTGIDRMKAGSLDLVASGGTIGALSYVIAGASASKRGEGTGLPEAIRFGEIRAFLERCVAVPLRERRRIEGLDPDRADIVCAGLAVALAVMRALGKRVLHPNRGGVREGALLHLIQNGFRW